MICYRGSIISQGSDFLDAYYQLEALKRQTAKTLADQNRNNRSDLDGCLLRKDVHPADIEGLPRLYRGARPIEIGAAVADDRDFFVDVPANPFLVEDPDWTLGEWQLLRVVEESVDVVR